MIKDDTYLAFILLFVVIFGTVFIVNACQLYPVAPIEEDSGVIYDLENEQRSDAGFSSRDGGYHTFDGGADYSDSGDSQDSGSPTEDGGFLDEEDYDHDNGHGNDEGCVDDSNPGKGRGCTRSASLLNTDEYFSLFFLSGCSTIVESNGCLYTDEEVDQVARELRSDFVDFLYPDPGDLTNVKWDCLYDLPEGISGMTLSEYSAVTLPDGRATRHELIHIALSRSGLGYDSYHKKDIWVLDYPIYFDF